MISQINSLYICKVFKEHVKKPVLVICRIIKVYIKRTCKGSPEKEGRGSRKEKMLVREVKGLRAQPELQQAFM